MAKAKLKTTSPARVAISIETSDPVIDLLQALVSTGLYGFTIEDAAERLLCRKLLEMFPPEHLKLGGTPNET